MENPGLFEKYLDGSLPETGRIAFQHKLKTDPDFEAEFKLYCDVDNALKNIKNRQAFKKVLNEAATNYFNSVDPVSTENKITKRSIPFRRIYSIAASVAAVVAITFFIWYFFFTTPTYKELYAENYHPLKVDVITRSTTGSAETINKALIHYQTGKYNDCLALLKTESFPDSLNTFVKVLQGLTYMETGDFARAEILLKEASADTKNIMYEDCIWYLSLTYLQLGQPGKCREQLEKLIAAKSSYSEKAKGIIEDLK